MRHRDAWIPRAQKTRQLDAEILVCVGREGKITGYGVQNQVQAPVSTIHYRLKRLVEAGRLDCVETRKAKVYSLPESDLQ